MELLGWAFVLGILVLVGLVGFGLYMRKGSSPGENGQSRTTNGQAGGVAGEEKAGGVFGGKIGGYIPSSSRQLDTSFKPEVLAIRLHCSQFGMRMAGKKLVDLTENQGLRFNDQNIFHYPDEETGGPQFKMIDGSDPGTFDLRKMSEMEIKSVALFMQLPGSSRPAIALQNMIDFARKLEEAYRQDSILLEFRDEDNNPLLSQWEEEYERTVQRFVNGERAT